MSEKIDQDAATSPSQTSFALPSDWEERLAAARLQREKVLKARGAPKKKRPRLLDEAGTAEIEALSFLSDIKTPEFPAPRETEIAEEPLETVRDDPPAKAQVTSSFASQPVSRLMAIGFACFFGLGCGLALSLGAIASLGMVFSDERAANPPDQPAAVAQIAPVTQPSLALAEPALVPAQDAPPKPAEVFGNTLSEAPDTVIIGVPKILASFNPPQASEVPLSVPVVSNANFQRNPLPSPLKAPPKDVLNHVSSEPTRTVEFVSRIAPFANDIVAQNAVMTDLRRVDAAPAVMVLNRLPELKEMPRVLPAVGAFLNVRPSLASQLGLSGPARERYSLVTYAPTNVSDARIAKTTEQLQLTGFPVASGSWVNFKISTTHIRYYSEQDEMVALAVAGLLGVTARDFSHMGNATLAGRIDVWLQGNKNPNKAERLEKQEASPLQLKEIYKTQLENRILNSLRGGLFSREASR